METNLEKNIVKLGEILKFSEFFYVFLTQFSPYHISYVILYINYKAETFSLYMQILSVV